MNLKGEFHSTLDSKGRVSIPAEFRQQLGTEPAEELVLTKNRDKGLTLFSAQAWKALEEFVGKQAPPVRRAMNMTYVSPATRVTFDGQGRVPISRPLRKHAGIDDSERGLVVVGAFDRLDIFSERRHTEVLEAAMALLNNNEELLAEFDLP